MRFNRCMILKHWIRCISVSCKWFCHKNEHLQLWETDMEGLPESDELLRWKGRRESIPACQYQSQSSSRLPPSSCLAFFLRIWPLSALYFSYRHDSLTEKEAASGVLIWTLLTRRYNLKWPRPDRIYSPKKITSIDGEENLHLLYLKANAKLGTDSRFLKEKT